MKFTDGEALVFARSATAGGQRFPVHWGGDSESTFVSMAESLRGGLSLGLSGFGFWSHDIGGLEGTPPASDTITLVRQSGAGRWQQLLAGITSVGSVAGGVAESGPQGVLVMPAEEAERVSISL